MWFLFDFPPLLQEEEISVKVVMTVTSFTYVLLFVSNKKKNVDENLLYTVSLYMCVVVLLRHACCGISFLKIEPRPFCPSRGLANRLWRPSLFWDDDALLAKPGSWINDPWSVLHFCSKDCKINCWTFVSNNQWFKYSAGGTSIRNCVRWI